MNSNNYGSREACERLVKAGIVLETEVWWRLSLGKLVNKNKHTNCRCEKSKDFIPALSMAEVWRELPEGTTLQKWALGYQAWIAPDYEKYHSQNINPTDALIELRIWLEERKEARKGAKI